VAFSFFSLRLLCAPLACAPGPLLGDPPSGLFFLSIFSPLVVLRGRRPKTFLFFFFLAHGQSPPPPPQAPFHASKIPTRSSFAPLLIHRCPLLLKFSRVLTYGGAVSPGRSSSEAWGPGLYPHVAFPFFPTFRSNRPRGFWTLSLEDGTMFKFPFYVEPFVSGGFSTPPPCQPAHTRALRELSSIPLLFPQFGIFFPRCTERTGPLSFFKFSICTDP